MIESYIGYSRRVLLSVYALQLLEYSIKETVAYSNRYYKSVGVDGIHRISSLDMQVDSTPSRHTWLGQRTFEIHTIALEPVEPLEHVSQVAFRCFDGSSWRAPRNTSSRPQHEQCNPYKHTCVLHSNRIQGRHCDNNREQHTSCYQLLMRKMAFQIKSERYSSNK